MRISVSNIAWPAGADDAACALLTQAGVRAIEIAPTKIWPHWEGISADSIRALRATLANAGLEVSSMQAVLFQKPELQLFAADAAGRAAFAEHLAFCAALAAELGAQSVVFGAPKNRDRGSLGDKEAFARATDLFAPIADTYAALGVALCLEANPAQYACNFITHGSQAAALVRAVASPGLRLHLDTACAAMAGEDIAQLVGENADILAHFHASEPMLGAVGVQAGAHPAAAAALHEANYHGWVAVEMRAQGDVLGALATAARFAQDIYGDAA